MSPSDAAHNIDVFGADVDAFRPERWIEATDQQWREMEKAGMVFSAGPRICIGRHLANIEMRKVIAAIIMTFKVSERDLCGRMVVLLCYTWLTKLFALVAIGMRACGEMGDCYSQGRSEGSLGAEKLNCVGGCRVVSFLEV